MATTGDFWAKGYGEFDPDDVIIVPFDFTDHCAEQQTSYSSHNVEMPTGLLVETIGVVGNVIKVRVSKEGELILGKRYKFGIQIVTVDGQKYTKSATLKIKQG